MTNQEIINTGQTIANETHIGGNTAERVGGVIEGIGENLTELGGYYHGFFEGKFALTIKGSYVNTSGVITADSSSYRTDYIDVSRVTNVKGKGSHYGLGLVLSFFDENKNFINEGQIRGNDSNTLKTFDVSVPTNAKYAIVCAYGDTNAAQSYGQTESVDEKLQEIDGRVTTMESSGLFGGEFALTIKGSYVNTSGVITADSSSYRTDYIDMSRVINVKGKGSYYGTGLVLSFFDENKNFINEGQIRGNDSNTLKTFDVPVPTNAKYAIVCAYGDTNAAQSYLEVNSIWEKIDEIDANESELNERVELLESSGLTNRDYPLTIRGSYVNTSGVITADGSSYRTDYIDVSRVTNVKGKGSHYGLGLVLSFFDENKNFINEGQIRGNSSNTLKTFDVSVPTNAKYAIVCAYGSERASESILHIEGIPQRLKADENKISSLFESGLFESSAFGGFMKFGVIGDSLSVGHATDPFSGQQYGRNIEFSWGRILARKLGNVCLNFGFTGATSKTWYTSQSHGYVEFVQEENLCQCYIVGLGANDDANNIGTINDIDWNDRDNNADSFYGNLGKVLQAINDIAPKAITFVFTLPYPRANTAKNTAIRDLCSNSHLSRVYLVDLEADYNDYFMSDYIAGYLRDTHYNAAGYANCAAVNVKAITDVMNAHSKDADNVMTSITYIPFGSATIIE